MTISGGHKRGFAFRVYVDELEVVPGRKFLRGLIRWS